MTRIERVDWSDPRAVAQRAAMDVETGEMYAEIIAGMSAEGQAAIDAVLTVDPATIVTSILALEGDVVVGHAALRPVTDGAWAGSLEVKRVFVEPAFRGTGVSRLLMEEAETIAIQRGETSLILQTGPLQHAAVGLYLRIGYVPIATYGGYEVIPGALCYEKELSGSPVAPLATPLG